MATDLPDWTQAVTVESGTVDIGGTVNATITSGTVDANITNASVPVSGSVSISSGTVDISAGTVDVQNASGTVIATGNAIDYLGTVTLAAGFSSVIHKFKVTKSYSALLVTAAGGTSRPLCIGVLSTTWNTAHGPAPAFGAAFAPKGTAADSAGWQAIAGCGSEPTSTVQLVVYRTGTTGTMTIQVYGVTETPAGGVPLRPDGRAYPLGSLTASAYTGTGATFIPAPSSPLRIMLRSVSLHLLTTLSATTSPRLTLTGTVNGSVRNLASVFAVSSAPGNVEHVWPAGNLLDPGTKVSYSSAGPKFVAVSADYDLVV